jgi:8-oxo-dGTP pyrophosphatase MutT (NUDIX family)
VGGPAGSGELIEVRFRPAVRIVCLDAAEKVLLLNWRDPHDGKLLWEPPGGGIELDESPLDTARRELAEETGFDPDAVGERYVDVERDVLWNGKRFVGPEQFFLARFAAAEPAPSGQGLLPDETRNLVGTGWFGLAELPDGLQPPTLVAIVRQLTAS